MKLEKDIYVAAREGGADPETNSALRLVFEKAKGANMPNENIDRAIQKAAGKQDGSSYEEITYEGYGPSGVAVMVECVTDNKNRTASKVRTAFHKNGGSFGENGCVSFLFERKGFMTIDRTEHQIDEDELMLDVLETGGEELQTKEDQYVVLTEPERFEDVKTAFESIYPISSAEVTMLPKTYAEANDQAVDKLEKLIDILEDDDDVQEVYTNWRS